MSNFLLSVAGVLCLMVAVDLVQERQRIADAIAFLDKRFGPDARHPELALWHEVWFRWIRLLVAVLCVAGAQ